MWLARMQLLRRPKVGTPAHTSTGLQRKRLPQVQQAVQLPRTGPQPVPVRPHRRLSLGRGRVLGLEVWVARRLPIDAQRMCLQGMQ